MVNVSLFSGEVDLKNLTLKKNVLDSMDIPIKLVLGSIDKLFIKVPLQFTSKPVKMDISGLNLVV